MTIPVRSLRLLLVDDQALVRSGLRQIYGLHDDIEVVAEAADGDEALTCLDRLATDAAAPVDCVVMDMRMRPMTGVEATDRIRRDGGPPVLALTTFDDDETLWSAIQAGVAGFILKEAPAEDIVRATRTVAGGGSWLDPAVTARVLAASRHHQAGPAVGADTDHGLTNREREVLALMAGGANNGEIAADLQVGAATVKSHISAIFTKLGARDRAAAIVYAHRNGLTQP